jgi:hypothetical protein
MGLVTRARVASWFTCRRTAGQKYRAGSTSYRAADAGEAAQYARDCAALQHQMWAGGPEFKPAAQTGPGGQPLRIESKNSALFFVCLTLSTKNSVASRSSIG